MAVNSTLDCLQRRIVDRPPLLARCVWQKKDVYPKLIMPDLRAIRQAVECGFGFRVLPDYLCADLVKENRLTPVIKPAQAVTNRIWLAFRKSEIQLPKIQRMLEFGQVQ